MVIFSALKDQEETIKASPPIKLAERPELYRIRSSDRLSSLVGINEATPLSTDEVGLKKREIARHNSYNSLVVSLFALCGRVGNYDS